MKIKLKNLGAIRQAEFELGDLTIICGGNNTGKTYATYALFGFLDNWHELIDLTIKPEEIEALLNDGNLELDISPYMSRCNDKLEKACKKYTSGLSRIFASSEKKFEDSYFLVTLAANPKPLDEYKQRMGTAKNQLFSITKKSGSNSVDITLLISKEKLKVPSYTISRIIGKSLVDILFSNALPVPFIASAERTGAAIFRKELNFARNRMLEQIGSDDIDPFEIISKSYSDYALPVKSNVDFTRQLEEFSKKESFITKHHPAILEHFADIIGGNYQVTKNDELYYVPKRGSVKLTMDESSSAVRSLLDIGFYLRHVAKQGDLLMVDEPELNLHPENQRRVARLFAQLVNVGVKVYMTTHSDYIVKEFNSLIMLNKNEERIQKIAKQEGYQANELLSPENIKVYIAEKRSILVDGNSKKTPCQTLTPVSIDTDYGIEARSFDDTIDDMNRIQEEIIWGE